MSADLCCGLGLVSPIHRCRPSIGELARHPYTAAVWHSVVPALAPGKELREARAPSWQGVKFARPVTVKGGFCRELDQFWVGWREQP